MKGFFIAHGSNSLWNFVSAFVNFLNRHFTVTPTVHTFLTVKRSLFYDVTILEM